jgi:hypothetical protein
LPQAVSVPRTTNPATESSQANTGRKDRCTGIWYHPQRQPKKFSGRAGGHALPGARTR